MFHSASKLLVKGVNVNISGGTKTAYVDRGIASQDTSPTGFLNLMVLTDSSLMALLWGFFCDKMPLSVQYEMIQNWGVSANSKKKK